ncbi:MAG: hypothetical protein GXY36_00455 [Chloroflexi bacterium]|nr:hypothetical protein [Chloroflexota bacterium]
MRQAPPLQQIVIVFMTLLAVVFALKIVLGLIKLAIPLLILAALIVGISWLFEKVRN